MYAAVRPPDTLGIGVVAGERLDVFDAAEAERWGLVNYVVPDQELFDRALNYCNELGRKSRDGLALMKRLTRQGLEGSLDDGLALEQQEVAVALRSPDVAEGLAAFQARREPVFK